MTWANMATILLPAIDLSFVAISLITVVIPTWGQGPVAALSGGPLHKKIAFAGAGPGEGIQFGYFQTICKGHEPGIRDMSGRIVIHGIQKPGQTPPKGMHLISVELSLIEGEIVPVAGFMYRVMKTEDRVKRTADIFATLDWVPDEKLPKGLLPVNNESFIVPLRRFHVEQTTVYDHWCAVTEIVKATEKKDAKAEAKLIMGGIRTPADRKATMRVGDIVLIGPSGFEVRKIIPADADLKTAGWVEFAQSFIPEADLIRDKKAYVRPEAINQVNK